MWYSEKYSNINEKKGIGLQCTAGSVTFDLGVIVSTGLSPSARRLSLILSPRLINVRVQYCVGSLPLTSTYSCIPFFVYVRPIVQ